jgi:hypothetical protein
MDVTECRDFSREYDHSDFGVVRVHNTVLDGLGGRRAWVKIESTISPRKTIYRQALGSGPTSLTAAQIELDYDSRNDLGIDSTRQENGTYPCSLTVRKCSRVEAFLAHWLHPDLSYQIAFRLGVLSAVLGVIGVVK